VLERSEAEQRNGASERASERKTERPKDRKSERVKERERESHNLAEGAVELDKGVLRWAMQGALIRFRREKSVESSSSSSSGGWEEV
jgi:hypothetical protein